MSVVSWVSLAILVAFAAMSVDSIRGWRRLRRLADVAPIGGSPPALTIVTTALDEAETIEPAVRSLLALDYPGLEIIAIDDRSTDATGDILDRLGREFPRLRVIHIRELPSGWLGKNHALHVGSQLARAEYLLFTDADVVYEATSLRRAIAYCEERRLDHLTLLPGVPARTRFIEIAMVVSLVGLLALFRPWKSRISAKHHMGVGAFNLVRAAAYRESGGHEALRMEVLDDMMLGKLMSRKSLRQGLLLGEGLVRVEIYRNAKELVRGIQKNVFTFVDYQLAKLAAATVITLSMHVWPFAALFTTEGVAWAINLATVVVSFAVYAHFARRFGYGFACLAYLPVMGLVIVALYWQIAIATLARGGIVWRGTFYPLAELRRHHRWTVMPGEPVDQDSQRLRRR